MISFISINASLYSIARYDHRVDLASLFQLCLHTIKYYTRRWWLDYDHYALTDIRHYQPRYKPH